MADTIPTTAPDDARTASKTNSQIAGGITATPADDDTKFQKAISIWRNIDFTNLLTSLDATASDIVTHQRDSLVQRKDLAQKTKDFRKLDDAAKLAEWKGLLKAYQTFIDLLTNHAKSTSSAFLQLYSSLSDAPDPYPLLEASIESLLVSEDTLPKITSENEHLQKAINKLTTQLEETENRLEGECEARKLLEANQEARIKEIETSWAAVLEEKKDNWEAKEKSLEEKIENQDRLFKEIKASYEVSQRLDRVDGDGEARRNGITAAELEIVHSDLERTSLRLAEVEARNEQLRLELAQTASGPHPSDLARTVEDDPAFLRMESENSSLLRKLDAARVERDSEKRNWDGRIRGLEREVIMLKDERDSLRNKVQRWTDYDEVKRELEMLKSIEFSTGDEDDLAGAEETDLLGSQENGEVRKGKGDSLEQLLLARNKRLGDELTVLRVSHQDLQSRLESLQTELADTNAELEKSRSLNATLENDLEKFQQETSNPFPSAMSVAPTYISRYPQSGVHALGSHSSRRGKTSPTSSIISGFDPHNGPQTSLDAIRAGESIGGGSSILPMVAAQRDRFKQRNTQLESELARTHNTVSTLRQEIASLQKDNLQLYEKTRYVSSYNRGQPYSTSSTAFSANPNTSTIQVSSSTASGLTLDRYRSAYEANLSPFAAFRGRESARAFKRMSLPERIVFSITRTVLANRMSRNLFAAYCLGLHVLVFGMLYWMGTVDIEKHASNLGDVAGGAVAAAAGAGVPEAHHGSWHQEGFSS
ncbi:hypothetical protein GP486_005859 [Trichoglossum hirsutum]|uniref:Protein CASP n=1 Tax=Trichoglossum hirsutum TaxID=265104 RepID=A0A9P8L8H7_9PEZI|nr:hypothetical protein GP486_005859 [Trichoglossum hirsutum]